MDSFTLHAVGHLARDPDPIVGGEHPYTRFCLVGNDYIGMDDEGTKREAVSFLWFSAFRALAETIVKHARRGDQLIVQARVRSTPPWTDGEGKSRFDHSFIATGVRFGAPGKLKRRQFTEADAQNGPTASSTVSADVNQIA
jgi:single-strand DNA-binding protein